MEVSEEYGMPLDALVRVVSMQVLPVHVLVSRARVGARVGVRVRVRRAPSEVQGVAPKPSPDDRACRELHDRRQSNGAMPALRPALLPGPPGCGSHSRCRVTCSTRHTRRDMCAEPPAPRDREEQFHTTRGGRCASGRGVSVGSWWQHIGGKM